MELSRCAAMVFILFLLFVSPSFSRGVRKMKTGKLDSEIYDIDYRGPETHSYRPPPDRGNHKSVLQKKLKARRNSEKATTGNAGKMGKKRH